ncbi:MAG TPA: VOC family protein [Terriglobales bacterium]|nr:VOC family protein [Terriglobales bacterium]
MARTSLYLHFAGNAEEAFLFYRSVFKTEFVGPILRFGDLPLQPGQPPLPPEEARLVMNISVPILGGLVIMGNDAPESMGKLIQGNNVTINLEPDTRTETDRLFAALKEGGKVECAPAEMGWGGYWGSLIDRFGIEWMFNCTAK